MGPNFGQQNVVKTHNTCVVNFQFPNPIIRTTRINTRCTLYVVHTYDAFTSV